MYLSSLSNYGNTILNDYANNSQVDEGTKTAIVVFINVLLFGSVLIFVGVFVWNFIRAYQGKQPLEFKLLKKEKDGSNSSMKDRLEKQTMKKNSMRNNFAPKSNICNVCGEANDADARFCKNCGTRL